MEKNAKRLLSLDFFRGATVAAMILVNNPGDWGNIYRPLEHSDWNGCSPADLVFPFFLFIVGVSIVYAMSSKKADTSLHNRIILKALKRALILFACGVFLSLYPKIFTDPAEAFNGVRIPGILQRIAIVFFISSLIFIKSSGKNILRITIGLLIFYWVLMTFVPVPYIGYANLGKETNLGAWVDRSLLTTSHLWILSKTWDPEGILGTIPSISSCLFGVLVGIYLKRKDLEDATKIAWMFTIGFIATFAGLLWGLAFPINKSLWTSSYVLYTGGLAIMILALSYWMIDVQKHTRFTRPFVIYGVNAITVFFLSALISRTINMVIKVSMPNGTKEGVQLWLYQNYFAPYFNPLNASLAWAIAFVLFWFIILWIMYKKNIIIKV